MQFFLIEITEHDGLQHYNPFILYKTEEEINQYMRGFHIENYRAVSVKCFEVDDSDILFAFLHFTFSASHSTNVREIFYDLIRKHGKVVRTVVIK